MESYKERVDALASLMSEFSLSEGSLKGDGWKIAFRKRRSAAKIDSSRELDTGEPMIEEEFEAPVAGPAAPVGTPVTSPMTGIYYTSPSPSSPPFVKTGESVTAGQVVGLIEAMKVFNEILAPVSGTVQDMPVETGQLVQPGQPLLYIS